MKMNEEMAVKLHRMMWSDMQKELGDNPDHSARNRYKEKWCETHFPGETILFNCFLCDYCGHDRGNKACNKCPIKWPDDTCATAFGLPPVKTDYRYAPISEILALPARNKELALEDVAQKISKEDHIREIVKNSMEAGAAEEIDRMFRALAEASGLSGGNKSINAHICKIRVKAKNDGRKEMANAVFGDLSAYSGVRAGDWCVHDHVEAIQKKASNEKELDETRRRLNDAVGALCLYQSTLSYETDLPQKAPVAAHIAKIREIAFSDGQNHERERIMDRIGEVLNS